MSRNRRAEPCHHTTPLAGTRLDGVVDLSAGVAVQSRNLDIEEPGDFKDCSDDFSGGQRALFSACLTIAMAECRPSFLYLLDEIDSPLDEQIAASLSQELRTRFGGGGGADRRR
eukprot:Polyplicarium_translucidae@DN1944_c0_g1_i3.p4